MHQINLKLDKKPWVFRQIILYLLYYIYVWLVGILMIDKTPPLEKNLIDFRDQNIIIIISITEKHIYQYDNVS